MELSSPRVGVGCLVQRGDLLLLVRRHRTHGAGTWSTPGGHLDPGEHPFACAEREVLEETGVRISNPRFLGVTNDVFLADSLHYVTLWVAADFASGEAAPRAPHELTEVRWASWDDLPTPQFPPLKRLLDGDALLGDGRGVPGIVDGRLL